MTCWANIENDKNILLYPKQKGYNPNVYNYYTNDYTYLDNEYLIRFVNDEGNYVYLEPKYIMYKPALTDIYNHTFKVEDHPSIFNAGNEFYKNHTTYENEFNLVIPGKNLVELSRILEDDKENVYLHIFNNKVLFKYKNLVFLSRLISGTYPVSSNIIPNEFRIDIECNYSDLYDMIDRASLLTSDKDKNTIKLELKNKELIISSNSPEIGKVEEKIAIDNDSSISISFSSKYMLEAIKSFNTEKVHLLMNNDNSPIIVKSDEESSLVQLVLPIKTY